MKKTKKQKTNRSKNKKLFKQLILIAGIAVLLIAFFRIYDTSFDKKIHMGGDNINYYILGKSLAMGKGYTNIFSKDMRPHNHFPVGYPLIIASTLKLSPYNIENTKHNTLIVKKLNGLFFLLSLVFLFLIIYKITGNYYIPFISVLLIIFNYYLLRYSVIMMSEIPFLFFTTFSIYLVLITDFSKPILKNWIFFILIILLSFTYHLRSTGIALFIGILFYLIVKKYYKYAITLFFSFFLLAVPWYIRTKNLGGNPYIKQLLRKNPYRPEEGQMVFTDWFSRIWANIERYVTREIPSGTFSFIATHKNTDPIVFSEWIIGIPIVLIMIYGLIRLKKYSLFLFLYIVPFMGILILWPTQWFGVRFILPLIPLLSFLFIYGVYDLLRVFFEKVIKSKSQMITTVAFIVVGVLIIGLSANKAIIKSINHVNGHYTTAYKNYFELAKWVKENAADTSVTACRKGEIFYFFSGKFVTSYKNTLDREEQIEYLKSKDVTYVVYDHLGYSSTGRYLGPAIDRYPSKFHQIKHLKNPDTYLFEFKPEMGYWGDWKNDKKDGKGSYAYSNGRKYTGEWKNNKRSGWGEFDWGNGNTFEGEWKNGLRNGKGTLFISSDRIIEGTWVNDSINGNAVVKSKDGEVIEERVYRMNTLLSSRKFKK